MSTAVNPPPQLRIPKSLARDEQAFQYFREIQTILFQLWTRTGGPDDSVESTANENIDTDALFGLVGRVDELESRDVFTVTTTHETSGNEIVICTDSATVSLNPAPNDQEIVTINRQAGIVQINGNGKLVNGSTLVRMIRKYMSFDIIYTAESDAWAII
jgi:hypothetical protein